MTEREQLLASILDEPDEDTPRLVYADWLEEHADTVECGACFGSRKGPLLKGQRRVSEAGPCPTCSGSGRVSNGFAERAEFIRVGVELATDTHEFCQADSCVMDYGQPCRFVALREREQKLVWDFARPHCKWFPEFSQEWTFKLISFAGECRNPSARVSRGFVSHLSCSCADFLRYAAAIFAEQPVEKVTLVDGVQQQIGNGRWFLRHAPWDGSDSVWRAIDRSDIYFLTEAEALNKLSGFAVAYGKARARAARGTVGVGT